MCMIVLNLCSRKKRSQTPATYISCNSAYNVQPCAAQTSDGSDYWSPAPGDSAESCPGSAAPRGHDDARPAALAYLPPRRATSVAAHEPALQTTYRCIQEAAGATRAFSSATDCQETPRSCHLARRNTLLIVDCGADG
eukprot:6212710-Pleurochrysis_carterae.AAC.5